MDILFTSWWVFALFSFFRYYRCLLGFLMTICTHFFLVARTGTRIACSLSRNNLALLLSCQVFFQRGRTQLSFPQEVYERSHSSAFMPICCVVNFFNFSQSGKSVVVWRYAFSTHFPDENNVWVPFHILTGLYETSFMKSCSNILVVSYLLVTDVCVFW